ncbi:putative HC-toxin efflux carrier TOXA [Glarea lozoyensis 74030]|uniref:Putative HC-toxin efflux carrier TOXA n=1 Tax=Glarea lozoyensis (strain ATCC 74030 / MF5533) TaxID=1104152 RepID=H0EK52_GLAL7|nr:putative HC-toxin efflux carrier TOXA [Glarea lozoyensis 74030]
MAMEKDVEKSTDSSMHHEETISYQVPPAEQEESARLNLQTILAFVPEGIFDCSLIIANFSPLISYAFIANVSITWRGAYWYMFSLHSCFFILLFFCYNPPDFSMKHRHDGKTKLELLGELDYVGVFLFTAAATLLLVGINFGGRQYEWKSPAVIAPIVVGFACAVALGFWETKMDLKYPLLPPKLFKKVRGFVMVIVVCFVGGMLYYSMTVLWPRQSATLFVPADKPIMRGIYANIFPLGTLTVGLAGTFRLLGGAIATAIYSAILTQTFNDSIVGKVRNAISQTGFPQSSEAALLAATRLNTPAFYATVPGMNAAVRAAAELAYKLALVFLVAIAFGVAATVAAFFTVSTDVRTKTNKRAVVLRNEVNAKEVDAEGNQV